MRLVTIAIVLITATALSGCNKPQPATVTKVEMTDDNMFKPADITVSKGATVRWTNIGDSQHSVESVGDKGPIDSPMLVKGKSYDHTFSTAGVFDYYCSPHGMMMKGRVTVT